MYKINSTTELDLILSILVSGSDAVINLENILIDWDKLYIGIGNANQLIESATASTSTKDAIKKTALGEGYFLRAYNYLKLVRQYGGVPLKLKTSSSGSIIGNVNSKNVIIEASSSGEIISKLKADKVETKVSSAGEVTLSGTATTAEIEASSSGDFKAKELDVINAFVSASSASNIEFTVLETLDARSSSYGKIWYYGNPTKVSIETSSYGKIIKK